MQSLKNPDLNISSLQYGLSSPPHSVFTPESFRSLLFRSSSLRLEEWELRTEDRVSQILSERLQPLSLLRQQEVKKKTPNKHTDQNKQANKKTLKCAIYTDY